MLPADTFDKVKAIFIAFLWTILVAAVAAALEYTNAIDWTGLGTFGPFLGVAIGTGLAALVGRLKKEQSGYGTEENPSITPLKAPDGD